MKAGIYLLVSCLVLGVLVGPVFSAKPPKELLPAPAEFTANERSGYIVFSWVPIRGADKYSVDVKGVITWGDRSVRGTVPFEQNFGTKDGIGLVSTSGGRMFLVIPQSALVRIALALVDDSGVDRRAVVGLRINADAKVKGLNPPGGGSQDNNFSNTDDFTVTWMR